MPVSNGFDEMVETYLVAHDAVMRFGTPEMKELSRSLLFAIGREVARRDIPPEDRPVPNRYGVEDDL